MSPLDVFAGPTTLLDVTTPTSSAGATGSGIELTPTDDGASTLSIVKRIIGAVVATVSLTTLAAMALPGLVGLLGTCAAGIRIGYRQAKAGSDLPATAIARFVGTGPVGVVRSGSQISFRPRVARARALTARASRADRTVPPPTVRLLDRAV